MDIQARRCGQPVQSPKMRILTFPKHCLDLRYLVVSGQEESNAHAAMHIIMLDQLANGYPDHEQMLG